MGAHTQHWGAEGSGEILEAHILDTSLTLSSSQRGQTHPPQRPPGRDSGRCFLPGRAPGWAPGHGSPASAWSPQSVLGPSGPAPGAALKGKLSLVTEHQVCTHPAGSDAPAQEAFSLELRVPPGH